MTHEYGWMQVTDAIQAAVDRIGASSMRMISRGYHDAGFMAQVCQPGP